MRFFKKVSVLLLLAGFLGFGTSSLGTPNESLMKHKADIDDLRCVIRDIDGNKIAACWFCDCQVLAYAVYPIIIRE